MCLQWLSRASCSTFTCPRLVPGKCVAVTFSDHWAAALAFDSTITNPFGVQNEYLPTHDDQPSQVFDSRPEMAQRSFEGRVPSGMLSFTRRAEARHELVQVDDMEVPLRHGDLLKFPRAFYDHCKPPPPPPLREPPQRCTQQSRI